MAFYISRPGANLVFKVASRTPSTKPYAVFEAHPCPEAPDFLDIIGWQQYRPPRPGVHQDWVVEVQGPARAISKEDRDELFVEAVIKYG